MAGEQREKIRTQRSWMECESWEKSLQRVDEICKSTCFSKEHADSLVARIISCYKRIEPILDRLCRAECPDCLDVCCGHATVWYDFRDLLFIRYSSKTFPDKQVSRFDNGDCSHLGATGCTIERLYRPFICTWYICPNQRSRLETFAAEESMSLFRNIDEIKRLRKELEELSVCL